MDAIAKSLIAIGLLIALVGVVLLVAGRVPFLGKLPGDIVIRRDGTVFYFPLMTSILLSIVLSIVLTVLGQLLSRRG
jgi:hypothetical protein